MERRYSEAAITLVQRQTKRPLFVAIDGYSAAGKSTLARAIAEALPGVQVVETDDFYRMMDENERFDLPPQEAYERDYDWQRLRRDVLAPLRAGTVARYRRYDWNTGALVGFTEVKPEGVVVVEGVYSFRPELRSFYDLSIFVTTAAVTRRARQETRPESNAWKLRWDAAEEFYVARHRPDLAADLLVCGVEPGDDNEDEST